MPSCTVAVPFAMIYLPSETLSTIFCMVANNEPYEYNQPRHWSADTNGIQRTERSHDRRLKHGCFAIYRVCSIWRDIILQIPRAWQITIKAETHFPTTDSNDLANVTSKWLQNSRGCDIVVDLIVMYDENLEEEYRNQMPLFNQRFEQLLNVLLPYSEQWYSFRAVLDESCLEILSGKDINCSGTNFRLAEFSLSSIEHINAPLRTIQINLASAAYVKIDVIPLGIHEGLRIADVTDLSISITSTPWPTIVALLCSSPNLVKLDLMVPRRRNDDIEVPIVSVINLIRLRDCRLRIRGDVLIHFLHSVDAPSLEDLVIDQEYPQMHHFDLSKSDLCKCVLPKLKSLVFRGCWYVCTVTCIMEAIVASCIEQFSLLIWEKLSFIQTPEVQGKFVLHSHETGTCPIASTLRKNYLELYSVHTLHLSCFRDRLAANTANIDHDLTLVMPHLTHLSLQGFSPHSLCLFLSTTEASNLAELELMFGDTFQAHDPDMSFQDGVNTSSLAMPSLASLKIRASAAHLLSECSYVLGSFVCPLLRSFELKSLPCGDHGRVNMSHWHRFHRQHQRLLRQVEFLFLDGIDWEDVEQEIFDEATDEKTELHVAFPAMQRLRIINSDVLEWFLFQEAQHLAKFQLAFPALRDVSVGPPLPIGHKIQGNFLSGLGKLADFCATYGQKLRHLFILYADQDCLDLNLFIAKVEHCHWAEERYDERGCPFLPDKLVDVTYDVQLHDKIFSAQYSE